MKTRQRVTTALFATSGLIALCAPASRAQETDKSPILEEIVVTANRREESIQTVPVAVTAMSGEALAEQHITTATDLLGRVPSLNVAPNGTQRSAEAITIRGQGQTYLAPVGVVNYFAEIPLIQGSVLPNQGGPGNFFDLENLQVLRGPQGTLFGKNTTGGALLFGPHKPTNKFEGYVQAQGGNYDDREYAAVINVPIVRDKLMIRLAATKVDRDGYTKDVGAGDTTLSLPFQTSTFGPIIIPNSGLVLPGYGPNTGQAGLPGLANTRADFRGRDYDDRHYWTARLGILFRPTDDIENYFVGYYTREHSNGTGQVLVSTDPSHPSVINIAANAYGGAGNFGAVSPTIAQAAVARSLALGPRQTALNNDQFYKLKTWAAVDILSIKLDNRFTFRNIIGYQRLEQEYTWDLDGSYLPILAHIPGVITSATVANIPQISALGQVGDVAKSTDASLLSEEPQLQMQLLGGKFVGVAGGFYSKQKPEGLQGIGSYNVATYGGTFFSIKTKTQAVYGQGALDLGVFTPSLDNLKITAGARQTWDHFDAARYSATFVNLPVSIVSKSDRATTWTAGLDYQITPQALVFGKVTRGYKAGGFNNSSVSVPGATFGPERVTSYEIGSKTDFQFGPVPMRFNVSLYDLEYKGIQRANGDNVPNGCGAPGAPPRCAITGNTTGLDSGAITYNAGAARVQGVEVEATARLFRGFELSGSYSYTDGKYTNYRLLMSPGASATGPQVGTKQTCDGPVAIPNGVTASPVLIDLTCAPFPFTPRNQYAVNARYSIELGAHTGTVVVNANFNHADRSWTAPASLPSGLPSGYLDDYNVVNASLEWNTIFGTGIDVRAFATNLTDATYRISNSNGGDQSLGYDTAIYNEPRMYGVSLRYRFGE